MQLGKRVTFSRYYRKNADFVNYDNLTDEQEKELSETDEIVLERIETVVLKKPLVGFIAGKRVMVKSSTLGFANYQYNPDGPEQFMLLDNETVEVYLIAAHMNRLYRVPAEWLEVSQ